MEKNMLYVIVRTYDGENLDPYAFTDYDAAYAKLKELYEDERAEADADDYSENDTVLDGHGFTVAYYNGYLTANIMPIPNPGILVSLPDKRSLYAASKDDPGYPGIKICVLNEGQTPANDESAVWMEYSAGDVENVEREKDRLLRIFAWNAKDDEPVVNLCYDTGEFVKE